MEWEYLPIIGIVFLIAWILYIIFLYVCGFFSILLGIYVFKHNKVPLLKKNINGIIAKVIGVVGIIVGVIIIVYSSLYLALLFDMMQ